MAGVRLGAGKSKGLNVPAQSIGWLDSCCTRGNRFTIAQDTRSSDPDCTIYPESGKYRLKAEGHQWNDRRYSRRCPRTGVGGIGSMPARISRYYSTPIACVPAAKRIKSNGP